MWMETTYFTTVVSTLITGSTSGAGYAHLSWTPDIIVTVIHGRGH